MGVPQFDILTLLPQLISLLIILFLFYYFNIKNFINHYTEIKKYRNKKLLKNDTTTKINITSKNNILWLLKVSYRKFFEKSN